MKSIYKILLCISAITSSLLASADLINWTPGYILIVTVTQKTDESYYVDYGPSFNTSSTETFQQRLPYGSSAIYDDTFDSWEAHYDNVYIRYEITTTYSASVSWEMDPSALPESLIPPNELPTFPTENLPPTATITYIDDVVSYGGILHFSGTASDPDGEIKNLFAISISRKDYDDFTSHGGVSYLVSVGGDNLIWSGDHFDATVDLNTCRESCNYWWNNYTIYGVAPPPGLYTVAVCVSDYSLGWTGMWGTVTIQ